MARSFSNAKLLSAFVVDGVSLAINRTNPCNPARVVAKSLRLSAVWRGYAAASQGVVSSVVRGGGRSGGTVKQGEERGMQKDGSETCSWVPDPVTGYYRPENRGDEIDVAELREMLLNHKIREH
ncbi:hypothetical protein HHK36_020805 [Tetracentron sinense]|uniref:Uncharacterized protein n=1 Tax=Tetracentron sinense TaxID=13715 RepID=A0A835D961_TETSI|nr:hypothetical protein HHK36_020805 [Tetracentron sinense]